MLSRYLLAIIVVVCVVDN